MRFLSNIFGRLNRSESVSTQEQTESIVAASNIRKQAHEDWVLYANERLQENERSFGNNTGPAGRKRSIH
jgi:hypothetical protein